MRSTFTAQVASDKERERDRQFVDMYFCSLMVKTHNCDSKFTHLQFICKSKQFNFQTVVWARSAWFHLQYCSCICHVNWLARKHCCIHLSYFYFQNTDLRSISFINVCELAFKRQHLLYAKFMRHIVLFFPSSDVFYVFLTRDSVSLSLNHVQIQPEHDPCLDAIIKIGVFIKKMRKNVLGNIFRLSADKKG